MEVSIHDFNSFIEGKESGYFYPREIEKLETHILSLKLTNPDISCETIELRFMYKGFTFSIIKYDDDWCFLIAKNISNQLRCFRCDQFEGIERLINDLPTIFP